MVVAMNARYLLVCPNGHFVESETNLERNVERRCTECSGALTWSYDVSTPRLRVAPEPAPGYIDLVVVPVDFGEEVVPDEIEVEDLLRELADLKDKVRALELQVEERQTVLEECRTRSRGFQQEREIALLRSRRVEDQLSLLLDGYTMAELTAALQFLRVRAAVFGVE
jgi:hypothetical protein